ncbi:V-set and transmembrane domain-containing protein 1 isoform X2 [Panthera uncia]|uniref:V-set and transmembrane domain-containing protein 1 isoform X2 n=1 Tax=Panthera uncia TaxID=29064 RepID=UPI0020FF8C0B|nr:V-set and transmembrane domain-containing protein 1 isoform X2 [Panthera uncia]
MITEFLSLLCLGLSLGFEDEKKNETLTKPYLSALPSPVVEQGHNVTLRCLGHRHNVTFMLGKLQDSGYRQEQRSAGYEAEFLLTHLEPKDAGTYFCAYKTMDSQEWSEESEHLQLEVTDDRKKRRAPPGGKDLSHEESTKRTSHSKLPQQEAMDADSSDLERTSVSAERPPGSELC